MSADVGVSSECLTGAAGAVSRWHAYMSVCTRSHPFPHKLLLAWQLVSSTAYYQGWGRGRMNQEVMAPFTPTLQSVTVSFPLYSSYQKRFPKSSIHWKGNQFPSIEEKNIKEFMVIKIITIVFEGKQVNNLSRENARELKLVIMK